ncbi:MAG: ROK family protein [Candidatus Pacebacteria bacterium]|jgi:glucokinase|nr:ROK family protein [Candidatus Paceibacterota bacterium]
MKNIKVLAFDMGGTKIASALVEISGGDYKILGYERNETPKTREDIIAKILELVESYRKKYTFKKIGFAVAGQVNKKGDTVVCAPNIASLNNFALGKIISRKTGLEVTLKNDIRAFAYGEDNFGKYKGYDDAVFIAVGTGVGGAIKMNGKFYFGKDNIAGEFGHMVIEVGGEQCNCGRKGCWERYVAGPGVEKMYEKVYGEKKGAKDIVFDAVRGDEKSRAIMEKASSYFAIGFANVVNILNPEIAVIGGSMVKEKRLLKLAMPFIKKEVLPSARKVKVVNSSLGDDAFLLGAALE